MMSPSPDWTDVLQTVFVGLQLLVLVAAALFARSQVREARGLREEQVRPFVVIDLDSRKKPFFDLVVKNIGTTMARNVKFDFEPEAESTMEHASLDRLKMFREGISTLPPGKEIRTLFENATKRFNADLPDVYTVRVSYQDHTGRREFVELVDLDFGIYWNRLSLTEYGIHDVYKQLDAIRSEVSKWTASPGGGILRVTPDDTARRNKEIEEGLKDLWWKPGQSESSEDDSS